MSDNPQQPSVRIICAVTHGLYEPWISILNQGQAKTWLDEEMPINFEVMHFHGTPVSSLWLTLDKFHEKMRWLNIWVARGLRVLDNLISIPFLLYIPKVSNSELLKQKHRSLHMHFPDTYVTYRWKLLGLLRFFLDQTDSDYLFVTSTASYIQPHLLIDFINGLPATNIYAGAEPYSSANFISGSNRIFSREIAQQIIDNRIKWRVGTIEDVAVSNLVVLLGNSLLVHPIINVSSLDELEKTLDATLLSTYHFRLKSGESDCRNDTEIMYRLHSRLAQLKGERL
jgi:hypothetical protein